MCVYIYYIYSVYIYIKGWEIKHSENERLKLPLNSVLSEESLSELCNVAIYIGFWKVFSWYTLNIREKLEESFLAARVPSTLGKWKINIFLQSVWQLLS